MKRSSDRILTTHTGSLPLPAGARESLAAKRRGRAYDQAVIDAALTTAVDDIVRRQVEVGVDIVGDGELSKTAWNDYVVHRVSGLERKPRSRAQSAEPWSVAKGIVRPREVGLFRGDLEGAPRHYRTDIAEFYDLARSQSDAHDNDGMTYFCTGPLGWKDFAAVETDIRRLQAARQGAKPHDVFMSALSPGCFARFFKNEYYASEEIYMQAVADVMRDEYKAIVDAGFVLQLDCPDLASGANTDYADLTVQQFRKVIEQHVECLNYALKSIPRDQVRMHICWGNYEGPHDCDVPLEKIWPIVKKTRVGGFVLPFANARHAHEYNVLRKMPLDDDQVIVAGVIDTLTNFVEHPEVVAERLQRVAEAVGDKTRVLGGTDCGFDSTAGQGRVAQDVAWAKLRSLVEGARLASERLF